MTRQKFVHLRKHTPCKTLGALLLLLLGTIALQAQTTGPRRDMKIVPKVGDRAPDFSLQDFGGNQFMLSKLTKTKGVLLWFTNLCEGCQSTLPDVQKLGSVYKRKGIEIVAVSVLGEDRQTVEEVLRKNNVSFQFLYDPKGESIERYSGKYVEGTCPLKNMFIIERGGRISYASHLPGIDAKELSGQLEKTANGVYK
jgi:peroxiredoxin